MANCGQFVPVWTVEPLVQDESPPAPLSRDSKYGRRVEHSVGIMRKTILMFFVIALMPFVPGEAQAQLLNCPAGTLLSMDQFGKPVCLQANNHEPAVIQGSPTINCASGTYPSVDNYGNRVCKSVDQRGPTDYSVPSGSSAPANISAPKTCPAGTFPAGLDI